MYIAGPMSGIPEFNYPAFHVAAKALRAVGYTVVNPAEISPEQGNDWVYYMRRDIPAMLTCESIFLLKGWENSKGATLEKHIAEALGMLVFFE